jgi:hypothetical protein
VSALPWQLLHAAVMPALQGLHAPKFSRCRQARTMAFSVARIWRAIKKKQHPNGPCAGAGCKVAGCRLKGFQVAFFQVALLAVGLAHCGQLQGRGRNTRRA